MVWGYVDDTTQIIGVASALVLALLWLGVEAVLHRRSLVRIPIRVHVAGSRGKTTVTRLVGAGLRGAGLRVLVKTTGTVPLVIMPDGSERPWRRRGLPSIGEQMRVARMAARLKVNAIVIESMAIQPEYLWASERYLVRATHAVVTNLRPDHEEELGSDPEDMAVALALVVPSRGHLVVSREAAEPAVLHRARALGTKVEIVSESGIDAVNRAMALAVCASVGVDQVRAREGMKAAGGDPGQFFIRTVETAMGPVRFASAFACNDPESFFRLWQEHRPPEGTVVLFNGRADRPLRTRAFLKLFATIGPGIRLYLSGVVPPGEVRIAGIPAERVARLRARTAEKAFEELAEAADESRTVWGVGNFAGLGARILEELRSTESSC